MASPREGAPLHAAHTSNLYPPVIINSLPKSGTHLLMRVLEGMPAYRYAGFAFTHASTHDAVDPSSPYLVGVGAPRGIDPKAFADMLDRLSPASYCEAHLPHTSATEKEFARREISMLLMLRDPRDVACSLVHYVLGREHHRLHRLFAGLPNMEARLRVAIDGFVASSDEHGASLKPLSQRYAQMFAWLGWSGACPILFEHLVGAKGGGQEALQERSLDRICRHLHCPQLDAVERARLAASLYSKESGTFRKGQIGDWSNHFTPSLTRHLEQQAGSALSRYLALSNQLDHA